MILPILILWISILRKECEDFDENLLENLVSDMFETMYAASGVGLAGPQIGISKEFLLWMPPLLLNLEEGEEPDEKLKQLKDFKKVFVNPIIENETGSPWPFSEGCLSIPGIREDIERKAVIKISYYDENWNFFEESYQGIAARIIQHEYDHIEGVLFTDHLNPFKKKIL